MEWDKQGATAMAPPHFPSSTLGRSDTIPTAMPVVMAPQYAPAPNMSISINSPTTALGQLASPLPPPPPMMLDVVVNFQYRGHHGTHYVPPKMKGLERRLRITIDDGRTAASIRDEVMARNVLPSPYQFLGGETRSQNDFELGDNDLVRYVSE